MNGTLTLKIFLSISLGLHLLFFSISSLLFPDFKVNGFRNLNLEISLLPLISETKALPQNVRPETRQRAPSSEARLLRRPGVTPESGPPAKELVRRTGVQARPTIYEQSGVLRKEKKEEPVYKKEQEPESPLAQAEMKVVSISNPSTVLSENEKQETENRKKEGIIMGLDVNPHSQTGPPKKTQIAMKNPSLSDGEILFVQPKYAENPKPVYPQKARQKGYEGEVILRVEVLPNGRVGQIEVRKSSGYELLDRSALATVKQWKFVPAKKGEAPIPLWVNIPVKFQLQ